MAELDALLTDANPPVLAQPLHFHDAAAPGSGIQAALQRHPQLGQRRPSQQNQAQQRDEEPGVEGEHRGSGGAVVTLTRVTEAGAPGLPRFNKPPAVTVPRFSARVQVSLRPSVLDPAGEATRAAAGRLGVTGVTRLRIGKAIEVELEADDQASAQAQLELLSDRLLANPVIENWNLERLEPVSGNPA